MIGFDTLLKVTRHAGIPLRVRRKIGKMLPSFGTDFSVPVFSGVYSGHTDNLLDKKVYLYGCHEAPTIRLIRGLLQQKPSPVYMDVGTNTGLHIVATSDCWTRCYGFEPNPHISALVQRNLVQNHLNDRVSLMPFGLSDVDADLPFELPFGQNLGTGKFVTNSTGTMLRVRNGDDVCQENQIVPDVIKIDVEGHEKRVLQGLAQTIQTHRPAVIFEYNDHSRADLCDAVVLRRLFGSGYRFWGILRSREYPKLVPFNPAAKYENVLAWAGHQILIQDYIK